MTITTVDRRHPPEVIRRHSAVTRLTHWINVLAVVVLVMSGLQIFNADPRLYWGKAGPNADMPFVEITNSGSGAAGATAKDAPDEVSRGTSLCRSPSGQPAAVQIGSAAELSRRVRPTQQAARGGDAGASWPGRSAGRGR